MKTKLFLIATLFITAITFSQTTKKGYDYYKAQSANKKMNKGELIDALAKDASFEKADAGKALNSSKLVKKRNKSRTKGFGATDISGLEKRSGRTTYKKY